jgi:hypothetical protein
MNEQIMMNYVGIGRRRAKGGVVQLKYVKDD